MAMTSYYELICECGHEGKIKLSENDTPYSSNMWEKYSLENLEGNSFSTDRLSGIKEAIENMKPVCPECKTHLTIENLKQ